MNRKRRSVYPANMIEHVEHFWERYTDASHMDLNMNCHSQKP